MTDLTNRLATLRVGRGLGLLQQVAEDEALTGREITLAGRQMMSFASCSYLGLEMEPALKAGAIAATEAYGTQFSASRAFLSAPPYAEAEALLAEITGRPSLLVPSTSLGHQAALPLLVGEDDLVLIDVQAHASLHVAANLLKAQGVCVQTVGHSAPDHVARKLRSSDAPRVWLLVDGIYSMIGDVALFAAYDRLLAEDARLRLYVDDAHATGWCGDRGQGLALQHWPDHARVVVALSLNKSFACAGGCLALADEEQAEAVRAFGPAMTFSGPVQPPMLGAILASARLHLGAGLAARQDKLRGLIAHFNAGAVARGLPLACAHETPMRYMRIGDIGRTATIATALQDAGYFMATVAPPAVAARDVGLRMTLTTHHKMADIDGLLNALSDALDGSIPAAAE
ncbi:aminotransferase class I/II-fold pyridoxal phosphate-dependent enzyme [Gymnodinialimonas hymeniacidonis]|uniref:aminotransferase class I/II-fold pyridoxal phosphate-dependent enzyme n=1 Tax=Gymnodinialimonas hymeniacidonis TaxID=3126508 RepID=UPI0034C65731